MKTFRFTVYVTVNNENLNAPDYDSLKLALEESINTPDNEGYGIIDYSVDGEEVENF